MPDVVPADRSGLLRITVAALTRARPKMLSNLLTSLGAMRLPGNTEVICLIVENDTSPNAQELVRSFAPLPNGLRLEYVLETEPGIPFGRNRASREAIGNGSDLLGFVDDDETVDADWLVRLVARYRAGDAVLIGGPVRIAPPVEGLGWVQRAMYRGLADRYKSREARSARWAKDASGREARVVTNNWLGETALFERHGIWFDETMRYTGGTDSKFCLEVVTAGLPVAWVPDALVSEIIPADRLTFAYQLGRTRDQTSTAYLREKPGPRRLLRTVLVKVPMRLAESLILALLILPSGGRTLNKLARRLGWVAGALLSPLGYRSRLYSRVTGS